MNNRSFNTLLSRGFDSNLAKQLLENGYNLTKLKNLDKDSLLKINIPEKIISNILKEDRPPIPTKTIVKLLYDSKRTCCICRNNNKSIIIHHIKEWHYRKDHSEENLVVLCLEHHNDAHTKKGLSLNLKPVDILHAKSEWLNSVKNSDAKAILGLTLIDGARWDYFNHNRIFELFFASNLDYKNYRFSKITKELGLINELGTFGIKDSFKSQFYSFSDGYLLYNYMKELFDNVLQNISLIDLTDKFSREQIKSLVKVGSYISIQIGFYFKNITKKTNGINQKEFVIIKRKVS
ncbi:hypothetical protein ASG22_04340 [Chryseobacterium sp. Leaf405]|uniref:HNH endonuclease signature motif containing protein n=1 Tax=Chryseobacterium sp. Leaf405 TaxID=1736367 RepID=UPI0006FCDD69|nr:HNH endonuclease signature motif containing protein [Chryseobacterium sp. Leaf405]KQT25933.1 hypothetical protein ASG22_04340 [Chryseobacterium sp. Leaf405]